ncbi:outer membrane protein assembly factor BamD [Persephonella sp.]
MKKIFLFFIGLLVLSCAQKEFADKEVFYKGIQLYQQGKFEDAKELLKKSIYKVKGLTADELMKARYYLANSYYKEELYVDAIVEFEELITLFPTAPFMDEVLYKLADSYLKISPGIDRDMTYPNKALEKAEELIESYPNSKYVPKAKEIVFKVNKMKADHILEIAELYEKLGKYYSAVRYYQLAFDTYEKYIDKVKVEYKLGFNLLYVDRQYRNEIIEYKKKIEKLNEKIKNEQDINKKNVLINRKKILEEHLNTLTERIKKSKERGLKIMQYITKNYKNSEYRNKAVKLLEKFSEVENY